MVVVVVVVVVVVGISGKHPGDKRLPFEDW